MRKTIIITGGSDGLGKTIALDLASNNNVIILSENEEKLRLTASEAKCEYYLCDVRDYKVVEQVVTDVINRFGQIDVLINNAGVWIQGELVDTTTATMIQGSQATAKLVAFQVNSGYDSYGKEKCGNAPISRTLTSSA